ncbi:MAG: putative Co/Zn/Cd efflux system rane fusion protein [Myxococcaceae bacterium]|nr:putative Co/Zn/Cd efflux system rane fusion protein [Myxococcaceae bacterium]
MERRAPLRLALPVVAVVAVVAVVVVLAGCSHKPSALAAPPATTNETLLTKPQIDRMKIATVTVELQDVDDTVLTTGKVAFDDQKIVHVFSPVAGRAVKVLAQLGEHVKKGDPLVIIESPDIGAATADADKARADLITAAHDFRRQKELLDAHAASQKDFEIAADSYRKAKAEAERAEQKARLFRKGDVVGQSYTLRSELDGEVFMKAVAPGMEIAGQYGGGTPMELFTVGQADRVWVLADVFELDIRRVRLGSKVVVNVAGWPDRGFEGAVDWISGALDTSTHAVKVRCTFDNADGALKPDMFATVKISVDVKRAIAIPRSAVLRFGDQTVAFVDRGPDKDGKERFERVPVAVDEGEGSEWLTVDHGLEKGDRVVTSGAILLSSMF